MTKKYARNKSQESNYYQVTIGIPEWGCAFSFSRRSRIAAFRAVKDAIAKIPERGRGRWSKPSVEDMDAAYASLCSWDRTSGKEHRSPRMTHWDSMRRWCLGIVRSETPIK